MSFRRSTSPELSTKTLLNVSPTRTERRPRQLRNLGRGGEISQSPEYSIGYCRYGTERSRGDDTKQPAPSK